MHAHLQSHRYTLSHTHYMQETNPGAMPYLGRASTLAYDFQRIPLASDRVSLVRPRSLCLANMYITMQLTQWFQPQVRMSALDC